MKESSNREGEKEISKDLLDIPALTLTPDSLVTMRQFRSVAEVENVYRFLYENDMRRECKMALEKILHYLKMANRKKKKN